MKNKFILVLVLAIVLKVVIAISTFHPDIRAFWLGGRVVATGHVLTLYDYLPSLPRNNFLVQVLTDAYLNYPPAIYFFHGIFNFLYAGIGLSVINTYTIENFRTFGNFDLNLQILLLKLPYLLVDVWGAFLITKLFQEEKKKFLAFTLWLFNPVSLYATYMMAQFDLIPATFIVLALVFIYKDKINLGAVALGVGIAFKIFPVFLLVPLALLGKNLKERMMLFILGIAPYVLSILPYINSVGYRNSALLTNQTQKSFNAQIPISSGESLVLFPLILLAVYLYWYYKENKAEDLWQKFLIVLAIFLVFTHYHPQWFLWITPLLIYELVKNNFKHLLLVGILVLSFIFSLFFFEASLTVNLFAPIWPNLYTQPTIWKLLNINIDLNTMRSFIQTIFAASAIVYIYLINKTAKN